MKNSGLIISSGHDSEDLEDRVDTEPEFELRPLVFGPAQHGLRLDQALVELVPEFSRSYLQQLVQDGAATVNGQVTVKPSTRCKAGDRVVVALRPTAQSRAFKPQEMELRLLFKDQHMLVIDKPDVIYENSELGTNFDAIQKNIATYFGPNGKPQQRGGTRLIIEELTICNANAQASADFLGGKTISIPLPDIVLKNLGQAKGGITPGELGQEIANALKAKLIIAGNFERLKKSSGESPDKGAAAIKVLLK